MGCFSAYHLFSYAITKKNRSEQSLLDRLTRLEARLELFNDLPLQSSHGLQQTIAPDNSLPRRSFAMEASLPDMPVIDAVGI